MRIPAIDTARGLGILLVVAGHNPFIVNDLRSIFIVIFAFHMPLFFFLSGLVVNFEHWSVKKACYRLLLPYSVAIVGVIGFALWGGQTLDLSRLLEIFYGGGESLSWPWVPAWYLAHYFLLLVCAFLLYKITPYKSQINEIKILIMALLLVFGVYTINNFYDRQLAFEGFEEIGLPYGIDFLGITLSIFMCGQYLREKYHHFKPNLILTVAALFLFAVCQFYYGLYIDFIRRYFPFSFVVVLQAIAGIYLFFAINYLCSKSKIYSLVFSFLGQYTITIILFHALFQDYIYQSLSAVLGGYDWLGFVISFIAAIVLSVCMSPRLLKEIIRRFQYVSTSCDKSYSGLIRK